MKSNKYWEELVEVIQTGNSSVDNPLVYRLLINFLSKQPDVIPTIMEILDLERKNSKRLIKDLNLNLTRNTFYIQQVKPTKQKDKEQREFFLKETKEFYTEHCNEIKTAGIKLWNDLP